MSDLSTIIDAAWERRNDLSPGDADAGIREAVEHCIAGLDSGELRVAQCATSANDNEWIVNEWLKKAVLLYFRLHENVPIDAGYTRYFDKVPLKYASYGAAEFQSSGTRVVPDAIVRRGAHVAADSGRGARRAGGTGQVAADTHIGIG